MSSFTAFTAATLRTLGVRARTLYETTVARLEDERRDERGLTTIEYAVILGVVIAIALAFAAILNAVYQKYAAKVT